jgi:hypothetical protein
MPDILVSCFPEIVRQVAEKEGRDLSRPFGRNELRPYERIDKSYLYERNLVLSIKSFLHMTRLGSTARRISSDNYRIDRRSS